MNITILPYGLRILHPFRHGIPFVKANTLLEFRLFKRTLETLPIEEYKNVCDIFDEGVYEAINLEKCVNDRLVEGGPSVSSIENQIKKAREIIEK